MEVKLVESIGYGVFVGSLHALQFTRSAHAFFIPLFSVAKPELSASGRNSRVTGEVPHSTRPLFRLAR